MMIRRLLLPLAAAAVMAGPATAADLPYGQGAAYAPPPVPIFTWTGLYLGGQIGYAWAGNGLSGWGPAYSFSGVNYAPSGVTGGAHVGYNLQFNQFVLGLEGDVNGTGVNKSYGWGACHIRHPNSRSRGRFAVASASQWIASSFTQPAARPSPG